MKKSTYIAFMVVMAVFFLVSLILMVRRHQYLQALICLFAAYYCHYSIKEKMKEP